MKTKSLWMGIVALVCAIVLPSCGSKVLGPEHYQVEIDDAFRVQIASAVVFMVYDDGMTEGLADRLDHEADLVAEEAEEGADLAKYKLAMERLAPKDKLVDDCLELYNLIEPDFSEWIQQADKDGHACWKATEQKSGIGVTFTNDKDSDWDVDLEEESYMQFVSAISESILKEMEE